MPIISSDQCSAWPIDHVERLTRSEGRDNGADSNMASNWEFHLYLRWSENEDLFGLWVLKLVENDELCVEEGGASEDAAERREYYEALYVDPPSNDRDAIYQALLRASEEFEYLAE
jgi:hypothetical protein